MSELLYPPIEPTSYLSLAEELLSRTEPSAIRTAGDRAYYAAFLTCRDELSSKNYMTPNFDTDDHLLVQSALRRREVLGSFGNEEYRLRRARNCVTYKTCKLELGKSDVRSIDWMIQTAKELIARVQALPPRP